MDENGSLATAYANMMHGIIDSEDLHNRYRQQIRNILNDHQIDCPMLEEKIVAVIITAATIVAKSSIKHAENLINNTLSNK